METVWIIEIQAILMVPHLFEFMAVAKTEKAAWRLVKERMDLDDRYDLDDFKVAEWRVQT